ncbi:MAG: type II toxin-antitoxin system VapC family toxin [Chloroflexi bacterium]|nr:type II toxin-antitoxin system VapC family toxin [Chloroflexota bacterium]MBI3734709.1 type II toxin-antitoxin system VapC family toxin [Chloroflexota bacterium]
MSNYLLDTNHASRVMANDAQLVSRIEQARSSGEQFAISVTVLGELYHAVYASQRQHRNMQQLLDLLGAFRVWPFDEAVAQTYGRIQAEQKAIGRPIPSLDVQIAAVARTHGLILLTADHHFQFVNGLNVQDWMTETH